MHAHADEQPKNRMPSAANKTEHYKWYVTTVFRSSVNSCRNEKQSVFFVRSHKQTKIVTFLQ